MCMSKLTSVQMLIMRYVWQERQRMKSKTQYEAEAKALINLKDKYKESHVYDYITRRFTNTIDVGVSRM